MKLSKFDTVARSNEGVDMELKDLRTGRGSGAFITLFGKDSQVFQDVKTERSRMIADRISQGKSEELSSDELDDLGCDLLARCTKGWRELEDDEGKPLVFDVGAARKLYLAYPAIREQVNVFIGDRANFAAA